MKTAAQISKNLSPSQRYWEKVWNTYIRVSLPWKFRFALYKHWEKQEVGGRHGPDKYVDLTESSMVLLAEIERLAPERVAPILDLGCNVGRHLNALWGRGYRNLHGVDVQHAALEHMSKVFPEMSETSKVVQGTFQEYLPTQASQAFDLSFTHGATIELVPPSFPICRELARVSRHAVVILIHESDHSYPRLWETEFLREGFLLTHLIRPYLAGQSASLMTFQRMER